MESYDLLMIVVLAGATLLGAWKGLAWQLASISSILLSYFVAFQFRGQVAQFISAKPPWNMFLAMLILYVASALVIWIAFQFVRDSINRLKLKEFDHHIGAVFGLAKGVVLCVVITLFAVTLLDEEPRGRIIKSRSGYYIAKLLDRSHGFMPKELHDVLHPHLHKLDESLPEEERHHRHEDEHQAASPTRTATHTTTHGAAPHEHAPPLNWRPAQPATSAPGAAPAPQPGGDPAATAARKWWLY